MGKNRKMGTRNYKNNAKNFYQKFEQQLEEKKAAAPETNSSSGNTTESSTKELDDDQEEEFYWPGCPSHQEQAFYNRYFGHHQRYYQRPDDMMMPDFNRGYDPFMLRTQGQYVRRIRKPRQVDDNDVKKKGVYRSCKLTPLSFYDRRWWGSRRERGGPSSAACVICLELKSISDTLKSPDCMHRFCKICVETYLADKIQEDINQIECPESKCKVALDMDFCKSLIPKEVLDKWNVALVESATLASPSELKCPFDECSAKFYDDKQLFRNRACPKCYRIFCFCCRKSCHIGKTCEENQRYIDNAKSSSVTNQPPAERSNQRPLGFFIIRPKRE